MTSREDRGGSQPAKAPESDMHLDTFICGQFVNLVALDERVAMNSRWYSWFNDAAATAWMQQHHFPSTRQSQIRFLADELTGNSHKLQLGIEDRSSGTLIGIISLSDIEWVSRRAEVAVFIGEPEFRTLDRWHEATSLIIDHAFKSLNLHRIYGGSMNKSVADLFIRLLGFRDEGVLRDYAFKDGIYRDCHIFGRIRSD